MDAVDLLFDIKRDDAELLHRFGLEVEDGFERVIADQGTGDPPAFKVVAAALGTDLFEGVDVDVGERHENHLLSISLYRHYNTSIVYFQYVRGNYI
jgi:hypothetical protein